MKLLNGLNSGLRLLTYALHPKCCVSCDVGLYKDEKILCVSCRHHLSLNNPNYNSDSLNLLFFGRISLQSSFALLNFNKKGVAQELIHQLKYRSRQDVGQFIAEWLGPSLKEEGVFENFQAIIPVPLHPRKLKKRGYNQLTTFCEHLSKMYGVPVVNDVLIRVVDHSTQTRLDRFTRWKNVSDIFDVTQTHTLKNQHVLLVDDVITTGATIEACANALRKIEGIKISLLTIAKAT